MADKSHKGTQLHVWFKEDVWTLINQCLEKGYVDEKGEHHQLTLTALVRHSIEMFWTFHVKGESIIHPDDPRRNL